MMSLNEHMEHSNCISTPIIVICNEFDKFASSYVPFVRMLSNLHKTTNVSFIFVFVCEFILPVESLIGVELTQELEVTFCTNGNQFDMLKQYLFNLFSSGTTVRISAQLLAKLTIHFIMYDNSVNNFAEQICTAIDLHFLENSGESYTAATSQRKIDCIRAYESFTAAINLLVIAIDTLSRKGEHSMLDVLLWATRTASVSIPSIITNEIDSSDQILKVNELLAVAEKSELINLTTKWIDYLNKFYNKDAALLAHASFILNQKQDKKEYDFIIYLFLNYANNSFDNTICTIIWANFRAKHTFVPLGTRKERKGIPAIINFIKKSVTNYVENFEKDEFAQVIIGANKRLWPKLIPSPRELNDSALQQTLPNELQAALVSLKRLSSRKKLQKRKELKEPINKLEWKEDFLLEMTKCNSDVNVSSAFTAAANDLKFMGVITENEHWNPLWDSVSLTLSGESQENTPKGVARHRTTNKREDAGHKRQKQKESLVRKPRKKRKLEQ